MSYTPSKELRDLRMEYANEVNSESPNYEKLRGLYDRMLKMNCRVASSISPERYKPCTR